jgi:hypothetical protein
VSALIGSVVIVGGSVLLSLAGVILVRRWVPLPVLEAQNDVAGFIIAVLGVAYGVLLAFVIFVVWGQFEDTKSGVAREANALTDAFRLGQGLPEPGRHQIMELSRGYARVVVGEEWDTTGRGGESIESPRAWKLLDQFWQAVRETTPRTPTEQALYTQLLTEMHDLSSERKLRLLAAREGIPTLMWVVLVIGAVVTVAFTYFFGVKSLRAQLWMTAALAGTISLNLFLIAAVDYPFTGDLRVGPEAFQQALEVMDRLASEPAARR